jgi:hypothetical protein
MPRRTFQPTGIDALEDRVVLTAFAIPFVITTTQPPSEVNPKFLILTKNTENQINHAITNSFSQFTKSINSAATAYEKGLAKNGADTNAVLAQLETKVTQALNRLTSALDQVASKVPYGGQNLASILNARIEGSAGVTDTTTMVNTPSLQTKLQTAFVNSDKSAAFQAIKDTQTFVRSDVTNYINLGVTNEFFTLGKGAILPPLS